jgi:hypothetical protein
MVIIVTIVTIVMMMMIMMIRIKTVKLLIFSKSSIPPLHLTYDQLQTKLKFISPANSLSNKAHADNGELVTLTRYAIYNRSWNVIKVYLRVSSCDYVRPCQLSGL